jgi:hypothetical protein
MKRLVLLAATLVFAFSTTVMAETVKVEKSSSTKGAAEMKSTNKPDNSKKAVNKGAEIEKARREKAENEYNKKSGKSQNTQQEETTSSTQSTTSSTGYKSKSDLAYERCIKNGGTQKYCEGK